MNIVYVVYRFDRRLTAIGKELESTDYDNLPARQWHKGYGDKTQTLHARVQRLSVRPKTAPKPLRLAAGGTATDRV